MTKPNNDALLEELNTKDCLAEVLCRLNKRQEAESMLRGVLWKRQNLLKGPPSQPDVRRTNNLAGTLSPLQSQEIAQLSRQVLEADREADGDENVNTIISMNNFAEILSRSGPSSETEAEDLMRCAVKSSQKVRGPYHMETVMLQDNLREILRRFGEIDGAEQMLRDRPAIHGTVAEKRGESDEREEEFRKTLATSGDGGEKVEALRRLADVLNEEGMYGEAESVTRQLKELPWKGSSVSNADLLSRKRNLGVLLSRQGKYEEAEETFRSLLKS